MKMWIRSDLRLFAQEKVDTMVGALKEEQAAEAERVIGRQHWCTSDVAKVVHYGSLLDVYVECIISTLLPRDTDSFSLLSVSLRR